MGRMLVWEPALRASSLTFWCGHVLGLGVAAFPSAAAPSFTRIHALFRHIAAVPASPRQVGDEVNGLHLLAFGGDQICAGSGHDPWVADDLDRPWTHRRVPLPADETIAGVVPTGSGVLWLTTTRYPAPGTALSGRLYRTENDGAVSTRVPVASEEGIAHE